MRCPHCGALNLPNAYTCKSCYVALMKKCPNCETMNEPNAKFCKDCGWALTGHFARTNKAVCSRCHSSVDYGAATCPGCGAPMDWNNPQQK